MISIMSNVYNVYIEHMGSCPARALDARKFESYFLLNGCKISGRPDDADCILFISCASKENVEDIAVRRIKELSRHRGELIVGGCLKGANEKKLKKIFDGKTLTTFANEYIDLLFPSFKTKFKDLPDTNILYPEKILQKSKRIIRFRLNLSLSLSLFKRIAVYMREKTPFAKAYYIRACWGCVDEHCTYCSIWRAVGRLKSKPLEICLEEFNKALREGYKRIILIGENVGAYGLDIDRTLPELLNKFTAVDGQYEIQLECLHPRWLIKYLDQLTPIVKSGKIKMIDCTIQSGNSRILSLMNRGYDALQLRESLRRLREAYPWLRFHTHIIVGFPSETDEEFEDTIEFIVDHGFDLVQVFPFSKNMYMSSEYLEQEIPQEVIKARLKKTVKVLRGRRIAYTLD